MSGTAADIDVMNRMAGTLRGGSDALEQGAGSLPEPPDAGAMTALTSAAMAHLTASVGGLVEGVSTAGNAVQDSAARYRDTDGQNASDFAGVHAQGSASAPR